MFRRVTGILAVVIGSATFAYFIWAAHRLGINALDEPGWPQPSPYPDRWLKALNDYYDAKYPAPPGTIKLHGELDRVLFDMTLASRVGGAIFISGLLLLLLPMLMKRFSSRNRGFEVITNSDAPNSH